MKSVSILLVAAICAAHAACQKPENKAERYFFGQNSAVSLDRSRSPLALVVEIGAGGKMSLNKIETGTIYDAAPLCEKLQAIFADRGRTGIAERKVYVHPQTEIGRNDLENLIEKLTQTDASPILLVGGE